MKKNIILALLLSSFLILIAYAIPPRYYNKPNPKMASILICESCKCPMCLGYPKNGVFKNRNYHKRKFIDKIAKWDTNNPSAPTCPKPRRPRWYNPHMA